MDLYHQAVYGPTEDRLKLAGTAWLCLSLLANFGRADLGGFVGLTAILAVVIGDDYLLRLFLVLAPVSLFASIFFLFQHDWSFGWLLLQLVHFVVQGASIWFAYQLFQESGSGEAGGEEGGARPARGARASQDPFQAYVPPQGQAHDLYSQQQQPHDGHRPPQPAVVPQQLPPPPQAASAQQAQQLL